MNLEDFKPLTRNLTAPVGAPSADANLGGFIAELRARDRQERRRHLGMALLLFPCGLGLAVAEGAQRPGTALIGVGVVLAAAYLSLKGLWFGRVDYATPMREFLAVAAKRYQFWRTEDALFAVPPFLALGLGGGLTVRMMALKFFGPEGAHLALAGYVVFLAALCVFAWMMSRKKWRRETAGLLTEIRQRQHELENG